MTNPPDSKITIAGTLTPWGPVIELSQPETGSVIVRLDKVFPLVQGILQVARDLENAEDPEPPELLN